MQTDMFTLPMETAITPSSMYDGNFGDFATLVEKIPPQARSLSITIKQRKKS